jgi:N-acetylmuramoyl-L-alanine amidase
MKFIEWLIGMFVKHNKVDEKANIDGILVLIVGHNVRAPGARAVAPLSMNEYQYNKNIVAPACVKYARSKGFTVEVLTKDAMGTQAVGAKATSLVKSVGKGCVIELHFNAFNGQASGTETLYSTKVPGSKLFAQIVQRHMVEVFDRPNRGLKLRNSGRGAANLAAVGVPCCLVEPLFGDNKTDALLMKTKADEYAKSLVNAAIEYLK